MLSQKGDDRKDTASWEPGAFLDHRYQVLCGMNANPVHSGFYHRRMGETAKFVEFATSRRPTRDESSTTPTHTVLHMVYSAWEATMKSSL